jgi:lipopolysaccharide transport system ATP-binding protein
VKPIVEVTELKKQFRFPGIPKQTTLKDLIVRRIRVDGERSIIDALSGVSFTLSHGQTLGIIGRNGSGKTTLMRIISGIMKPDSGKVEVQGKVVPILSLGATFNPLLTGRENAMIELLTLGITRTSARSLMADIFEFAELEEFIDAPMRTYSTGMAMRLAFSAAVCVSPDILVLDEVLAVGDEGFARKSALCIQELRKRGSATILVTHDTHAVLAQCDVALWLDNGRVAAFGEPHGVVAGYRDAIAR